MSLSASDEIRLVKSFEDFCYISNSLSLYYIWVTDTNLCLTLKTVFKFRIGVFNLIILLIHIIDT